MSQCHLFYYIQSRERCLIILATNGVIVSSPLSPFNSWCGTFISVRNHHLGQLRLAIHSWVGAVSTSQRAMTPSSWRVKASIIRLWVASKTVWSCRYTWGISQHFKDVASTTKRCTNSRYFTFTLLYLPRWKTSSADTRTKAFLPRSTRVLRWNAGSRTTSSYVTRSSWSNMALCLARYLSW